jgi:hypothetical protein
MRWCANGARTKLGDTRRLAPAMPNGRAWPRVGTKIVVVDRPVGRRQALSMVIGRTGSSVAVLGP